MSTFERNSVCILADYALDGGVVHVVNWARVGDTETGEVRNITGVAYASDASKPAELVLQFDNGGPPGTYWVIDIGPVVDDKYQYSVVSDERGFTLFVLARDVETFNDKYNGQVYEFLQDHRLAWRTVHTVQDGCSYPPLPEPKKELIMPSPQDENMPSPRYETEDEEFFF